VRDIFEADDMTIVNLEGVLTTSEEPEEGRTFNIKGDPSYVGILTAGNVEAVSMANNHRLDYGEAGTEDTVKVLEEAGIVYAYDKIVGMYEVKGINIGIVSVNEVAWGDKCGPLIESGIGLLKEQEADLIIACCHWGVEKEHYTEEYQNELGRICIDAGADLVLGHHPHVLQGIEEYQGKYIVYSLANFCFGANRNPSDKDTMIFQQTFTFADGVLQEDRQARVIPCSVSSVKERNNYQPTPLTGEDAERVINRLNTYSEAYGMVVGSDGNVD
jgi:poly-gamma-glutamate synthesis protein (capsule biosynthesis protein)